MFRLIARVLLLVGLLGGQAGCAKGRTVASVVEELRARGVGSELGDPAGFEAVRLIAVKDARTLELWARKAGAPWAKLRVVIMPVDFRRGAASPEIAGIGWEAELYAAIRAELKKTFGE